MRPFEERLGTHPVFRLPGVSRHNVSHDALHVLYTKGTLAHSCGSILHELCWQGPGRQSVKPADRLEVIFKRTQQLYGELGVPHGKRLNMLKLSMFTDVDKPHQQHPFLKTKGGEMKHFVPVLTCVAKETSRTPMDKVKVDMLASIGAARTQLRIAFALSTPAHSTEPASCSFKKRNAFRACVATLHSW